MRCYHNPVRAYDAPPGLAGQPLGAAGIPTTRSPGIAANFREGGVIYVIRVPKNAVISPRGWEGFALENEYIIFNRIPPGSIVQAIPANRVAPLTVNKDSLLAPGR